jgi:hypothetical protein
MATPDFDPKEFWTTLLKERTTRFHKLVELNAPAYILCSDLMLLMKAVAGLYPEDFGKVYSEMVIKSGRIGLSLCAHCGKPHEQEGQTEPWCADCEADAAVDVASSELEDDPE